MDEEPSRSEVARHLFTHGQAETLNERASALVEAWRHAGALHDDTSLRHQLQRLPSVPPELMAAYQLEKAVQAASGEGGRQGALEMLDALEAPLTDRTRWTAARIELLRASLLPPSKEQQALVALRRVGRLNPKGAVGAAQRAQAWLLEGSIEHRSGRYKEAIAAYLKVSSGSGLWREARLGMAWSQLRIAQPDRALASLALLPGGITGEPERALVAAMAAGTLGKIEAALAVVEEARSRSKVWLEGDIDRERLLADALPIGRAVRLREADEGLHIRLTAHPVVRIYSAEVRAARALSESAPGEPEALAYVARLEAAWAGVVDGLVSQERARIKQALLGLDALEPQLK